MTKIELLDSSVVPFEQTPKPENWYIEPFTKPTGCKASGQCESDCDCSYKTMIEAEHLPLIADIAQIFPNEWLAFIISPAEDDEYEPIHGKLVAHSDNPDEIYNAVNTVLWNQCVYIFFNGNFEAMQASYGSDWDRTSVPKLTSSGPQPTSASVNLLSDDLMALIYSAIDQLCSPPKLNEAIRRLRLVRVKAAQQANNDLITVLDKALDQLECPLPFVDEVIWCLEEACADFGT